MKDYIIGKRYAEAFLDAAEEVMSPEDSVRQISDIAQAFKDSPELAEFFASPSISHPEKIDMINKVFDKGFDEITRVFLDLLLRKGRFGTIPEIAESARALYEHRAGTKATIRAAKPVADEIAKKIEEIMERRLEKKLVFNIRTEEQLLGGIQVAAGGIIVDGSMRKRLYDLREKLRNLKID